MLEEYLNARKEMEEAKLVVSAILLVCSAAIISRGAAEPVEDKQSLLDFIVRLPPRRGLNWSPFTSVCDSWRGVACSGDRARVVAVRLPGIGFDGPIPPNTLGRLTALQILSLRSNGLYGPFPADLANLTALTSLHLQLNSFSGPLPSNLSAWKNLTVLDISFNAFNGSIPASLSNLTQLTALNLSNNSFSGEIPDLDLPNLQLLNLSNNQLNGSIPKSIQKFPYSSFSGNHLSPISPSPSPASPIPSPSPSPSPSPPLPETGANHKLGESAILAIAIGGCVVISGVITLFLFRCCSNRNGDGVVSGKGSKGDRSPEKAMAGHQDEINRLVFFEGTTFAFDLEDLLRASAEVLGKGTFGTTYKAVLEDATMVVVKRLKDVAAGKKEFEQQMEVVGSIKHENVVDLRAYYYSKDEKLMVFDYFSQGSVASLLHGKRGEERTPLDWETRLRIAIGAARGIAHIHTENNGKLVHGNIKSSNVFLNSQQYGCVSDLGLASLMNPMISPVSRTAGYRAPEVVDLRKATQASDVYSFGVLVLELLTGKSPIQITGGGDEVVHLVRWVQAVVREEWTAEVFDMELMRYPNIEEEMVEMLQIAMTCVVRIPEQRPKMSGVVRMIEDVRRFGTGNRPSSEGSTPPPVQAAAERPATPQQGP